MLTHTHTHNSVFRSGRVDRSATHDSISRGQLVKGWAGCSTYISFPESPSRKSWHFNSLSNQIASQNHFLKTQNKAVLFVSFSLLEDGMGWWTGCETTKEKVTGSTELSEIGLFLEPVEYYPFRCKSINLPPSPADGQVPVCLFLYQLYTELGLPRCKSTRRNHPQSCSKEAILHIKK